MVITKFFQEIQWSIFTHFWLSIISKLNSAIKNQTFLIQNDIIIIQI